MQKVKNIASYLKDCSLAASRTCQTPCLTWQQSGNKCDYTRDQTTATLHQLLIVIISVVVTNTLNMDPDQGFWHNLDPDPELYYRYLSILKEKNKIILEKQISFTKIIGNNYKNKMSLKEIFTQLSL